MNFDSQKNSTPRHWSLARRRLNPNHWLALTRLGCGLSVTTLYRGFEGPAKELPTPPSDHSPLAAPFVNSERGLRPCLLRSFFWFWKCSRASPHPMEARL